MQAKREVNKEKEEWQKLRTRGKGRQARKARITLESKILFFLA